MTLTSYRLLCAGSLLALTAFGAVAQSAPLSAASAASQPSTAIAVPPKKAAEAADKAIPRSDVGTVVKTGPTVADKAHEATGKTPHHAHAGKHPHHAASAASAASATGQR